MSEKATLTGKLTAHNHYPSDSHNLTNLDKMIFVLVVIMLYYLISRNFKRVYENIVLRT
jgi:hypothetical protein